MTPLACTMRYMRRIFRSMAKKDNASQQEPTAPLKVR